MAPSQRHVLLVGPAMRSQHLSRPPTLPVLQRFLKVLPCLPCLLCRAVQARCAWTSSRTTAPLLTPIPRPAVPAAPACCACCAGTLCLDIIQDHWSPCHNICSILTSIQSLLTDPNCASPANPEAAQVGRGGEGPRCSGKRRGGYFGVCAVGWVRGFVRGPAAPAQPTQEAVQVGGGRQWHGEAV